MSSCFRINYIRGSGYFTAMPSWFCACKWYWQRKHTKAENNITCLAITNYTMYDPLCDALFTELSSWDFKMATWLQNLILYNLSKCKFRTYDIRENSSKLYMNKTYNFPYCVNACQTCLTTTTKQSLHNVRRRT